MSRRTVRLVVAVLAAALVMGACGDDDDGGAGAGAGAGEDTTTKPKVEIPDGSPPAQLQTKDRVVGTGPEAKTGQQVTMQYVGVSWSTKEQFDASWDRGGPFGPFPLGVGRVIEGWDQGIPGMKVGGRRELIIPPDLGYGAAGFPPDIAPDETLVFVVDLLAVE